MFCGIIDLFSPTTSFKALCSMGKPDAKLLPCAAAYISGGVGLFTRNCDTFLTYPMTKTVNGGSITLMLEGALGEYDADRLILRYARDGEAFLRSLSGSFALALFDSGAEALYLLRGSGGAPVYFSGDIRLVFSTSEDSLAAFPEKLYGISRLRENSLLKYNIQGVRFI